ncbi:hypothetical protein BLOT_013873 [Blomia tropicalis]|nr:hypothetical protein BLOT_013873 [Blomia tropicalis]
MNVCPISSIEDLFAFFSNGHLFASVRVKKLSSQFKHQDLSLRFAITGGGEHVVFHAIYHKLGIDNLVKLNDVSDNNQLSTYYTQTCHPCSNCGQACLCTVLINPFNSDLNQIDLILLTKPNQNKLKKQNSNILAREL